MRRNFPVGMIFIENWYFDKTIKMKCFSLTRGNFSSWDKHFRSSTQQIPGNYETNPFILLSDQWFQGRIQDFFQVEAEISSGGGEKFALYPLPIPTQHY